MKTLTMFLFALFTVFASIPVDAKTSLNQPFTYVSTGDVTSCSRVRVIFGNCQYIKGSNSRMDVVHHGTNKVLRFRHKQGKIGPDNTGGAFRFGLDVSNEYNLEYKVRFGSDFDFALGGKLPGMAGGNIYNGGRPATAGDGFNARMGWAQHGQLNLYMYYQDQPGNFGHIIFMDDPVFLQANGTYTIRQYIKTNTPGINDGVVKIWVDGVLVLSRNNIRFMSQMFGRPASYIDKVSFDHYHGGSTLNFAPANDTHADFDNVNVW